MARMSWNRRTRFQRCCVVLAVAAAALLGNRASAEAMKFPAWGTAQSVRGELVAADFIHRTGQFRRADGRRVNFAMPPYGIFSYRGTEADLRDVPLGTEFDFLLVPDDDGRLVQLVGTKHAEAFDESQRKKFVDFTTARGLAGWIDATADKTLTVTFFSGDPERFDATWAEAFAVGADVTVCVANDELRTWQPTSCGERGRVVEVAAVPIAGYGCSGRQVVLQVNNMLEGFRRGRIVRVFGAGWKVRNQFYQECLINYGYVSRQPPEWREVAAKHYPESFPYRTDYGNRHLPWYRLQDGVVPPLASEHRLCGDLVALDAANQRGEFKTEGTGELIRFTLLDAGARLSPIRVRNDGFEGSRSKLSDLRLGERYRFAMYQDGEGRFTRCSAISDEYSHLSLNLFSYRVREFDRRQGRIEVDWQSVPVLNYQKDQELPPPYGRSILRVVPETRFWKGEAAVSADAVQVGGYLKVNLTSEFADRPSYCTDVWIVENQSGKSKSKK